jgi:putative membrane protein
MVWYGRDIGGGFIAMMIGLLTTVIVIAVILRVVDRMTGREIFRRRPTPDEVLADRYARGELTDEEYRHRLSVLHGDDHALR